MHGDERLEYQVMAGAQMCAFVAQDRDQLGLRHRGQGALAEHHPAAHSGQAVRQWFGHPQDPRIG